MNTDRKRKKQKIKKKRLKIGNYFNSGLNWSYSDHVFWSKYSLFGLKFHELIGLTSP